MGRRGARTSLLLLSTLAGVLLAPMPLLAQAASSEDPIGRYLSGNPEDLTISLKIMALLTVLTIAPSILLLTTAFPRIVIVLGFVRRAISAQEVPPNQVVIGFALILTFMVMTPTWARINANALGPFLDEEISDKEALDIGIFEIREFMIPQIDTRDLHLMVQIANPELIDGEDDELPGYDAFQNVRMDDIPLFTLIPAFLLSELKRAFEMGFMIYLPFLVIDLVVASTLISMGMLVLPPVLISLPFKILVFVLVDGWGLVVEQLVLSFAV